MYPYSHAPDARDEKFLRHSVPAMRYNPYQHSQTEKEYYRLKNNPNTFNNIFSRDIRVRALIF